MLNRSIVAGIVALFCVAVFSFGCKKNCSSTVCHSYGYIAALNGNVSEVCSNGVCYCPNGLEGDSCQTLSLIKYVQRATWSASEGCSGYSSGPYYVTMSFNQSTSLYNNVFYINGLFGGSIQVEADIISNASHQGINLNIPQQTIGNASFYGSGVYSSNGGLGKIILNIDYIVNNGNDLPCTVLLYQQ